MKVKKNSSKLPSHLQKYDRKHLTNYHTLFVLMENKSGPVMESCGTPFVKRGEVEPAD